MAIRWRPAGIALLLLWPMLAHASTADQRPNLILDGGFEQVREANVGVEPYLFQSLQEGMDLGSKGPVIRLPINVGLFCGVKRLHIVEGSPGKQVHTGRRAIRLTGSYYVQLRHTERGSVPIRRGDRFRARYYVKGTGTVRLLLSVRNDACRQVGQVVPAPVAVKGDQWARVEHTYDTADQENGTGIGARVETQGDVWIDDMTLVKTGSASGKAASVPVAFALPAKPPPKIDGRLDDACWRKAARYGPFVMRNDVNRVCEPRTFFQAACDDEHVYLAIIAVEPNRGNLKDLKQKPGARDSWPHVNCIGLFLDTHCDRSSYHQLATNLAGTRFDSYEKDPAWNGTWRVASQATGKGWTMEIAIAFAGLFGGRPEPGTRWGVNVCRNRPGGLDYSGTWAPTGIYFHSPGKFNTLVLGTVAQWWDQQMTSIDRLTAAQRSRLDGLEPGDTRLETKLAAAGRRKQALPKTAAGLAPTSAAFIALYDEVQSVWEDFRAVADESEAAVAIEQTIRSAKKGSR